MKAKKRFLSLLLCGAMLFSLCPQVALAEAAQNGGAAGGLCEHHPQHTAECGYTEGSEGTPCTFTCKICNPQDSGEMEETGPEAECICTGLCTEETVNAECPVCGAGGGADLTACAGVEAEMAALPNALAAEAGVKYLDADGNEQTTGDRPVTVLTPSVWDLKAGWYVVNGTLNIPLDEISVSDDVHLILTDGCMFRNANNIRVSEGGSLTIYAQSTGDQMGQLFFENDGIRCEGGDITINGGVVSANDAGITCEGGDITINGGTVTAANFNGPGIGIVSSSSSAGTITINGGTVTARGSNDSAGIGSGTSCSFTNLNITITGGTVTATGGQEGAGIGCGTNCSFTNLNITITGGTVTAQGNDRGAGIGSGNGSPGHSGRIEVVINGGTVTATGGETSAGIGSRSENPANYAIAFSTGENGSAVIFAKNGDRYTDAAISDESGKENWSGIIFEGATGQVYGDPAPTEDFTIPENYELTIPGDVTLTIPGDVTLTNKGTITVEADGGLSNNGTILMEGGTITGAVDGNTPGYPTSVSVSAEPTSVTFGDTVTLTATVTMPSGDNEELPSSFGTVSFSVGEMPFGDEVTVTSEGSAYTAKLSVNVTTDNGFAAGDNTITATYSGAEGDDGYGLAGSSDTVTLTVNKVEQTTPPAAPSGTSAITANSITLTPVTGDPGHGDVQYGYTTGEEPSVPEDRWQGGTTFDHLAPGTAYTFYARYAGDDCYEPSPASSTGLEVTTKRAGSALTVEPAESTLTYGDTLTLTVTPEQAAANGINTLDTALNTVELYNGDQLLLSSNTANAGGSYTLTYDTRQKGLTVGKNTLTVSYGGSGSLEPSTATVNVTLAKKEINASLTGTATKPYDGTTAAPEGLTIALTGVLDGDGVTATGTIAYNTKDVGDNKTITASGIELKGNDAGYYSLSSQTATATGSITVATLSGALTITGTEQYGQTLTASYMPKDDETVSYQWNRNNTAIANATNSTYTLTAEDVEQSISVTATATDDNHTGSVTSKAVTVGKADLAAPQNLNLASAEPGTATAAWDAVQNANGYTVQLYKGDEADGNPITTTGTSCEFSIAEAGGYTFAVKANGSDSYADSAETQSAALNFYTVSFTTDGGAAIDPQIVANGGKVTAPADPAKTGYTFEGWYSDEELTDAWDFDSDTVAEATTLYAKWAKTSYSVTVTVENEGTGTASASQTSATMGNEIVLTAEPADGCHFVRWDVVSGDVTISEQNTFAMPAGNVTINAVFEPHSSTGTWQSDENGHWKVCDFCSGTIRQAAHTSNEDDGDCTTPVTCSVCGYMMIPAQSSHDYQWTSNDNGTHSGQCMHSGCSQQITNQSCDYDENGKCTVCGYEKVNPKQYTLTIELNGGSGASAGGDYAEGAVIQIDAGTRPNYRFTGWTSSDGGVFADASNASTTFTMPASDTTVTANWQYSGSSSGGGGTTAPTYRDETLSAEGVTLSGSSVHKDAHLTVTEDALHDAESCGYCGQIRKWQAEGRVLAIYDVSLSRGFRGSVTLTFPVPESYSGRMLSVVHCLKDRMDTYEVTVSDGTVRVTVDSLSPFVILCDPADPENPDDPNTPADPEEPGTTGLPFTDVAATNWYYDAVAYAYENGLMTGTSETLFDPDGTTTRGMIATILYRLEGGPEAPACDFTDVEEGKYYTDAIAWASENNLVNGYGDGMFGPDANITREQMSALLYRYAEFKGYDLTARGDLSGYTDAAQISDYAVTAMQWAIAEDLVNGMGDGTLVPQGDSTRAQIATMLMRFLENVAEK